MGEKEGGDPQYAPVGEDQKTKDYIALKRDEENIARQTGKDFSKTESGPGYEDLGEDKRTKDYLDLKKDEERISKETGKDFSRVK